MPCRWFAPGLWSLKLASERDEDPLPVEKRKTRSSAYRLGTTTTSSSITDSTEYHTEHLQDPLLAAAVRRSWSGRVVDVWAYGSTAGPN